MLGQGAGLVAVVGAFCALLWGLLGWQLGRQADDRAVPARQLSLP